MEDYLGWARAQGGLFTTSQAARHGLDADALTSIVRTGVARRLAQGVYALGSAPPSAEGRHLELCRGMLLRHPDAVLAGRSAVAALELPVFAVNLERALLLRAVPRQTSRSGCVVRSRPKDLLTMTTPTGEVEAPASAITRLALDHGSVPGVVAADAALHGGLLSVDELDAEIARCAGHRRVQQALAMRQMCDAASESPGETRLRVLLTGWGYTLESQFAVARGPGLLARADFRVAGTRVLIEFDGLVKYEDGGVRALVDEKRREDDLRARGWIVIRFTWRDLEHPQRILAEVRRAVALDHRLRQAG